MDYSTMKWYSHNSQYILATEGNNTLKKQNTTNLKRYGGLFPDITSQCESTTALTTDI